MTSKKNALIKKNGDKLSKIMKIKVLLKGLCEKFSVSIVATCWHLIMLNNDKKCINSTNNIIKM